MLSLLLPLWTDLVTVIYLLIEPPPNVLLQLCLRAGMLLGLCHTLSKCQVSNTDVMLDSTIF